MKHILLKLTLVFVLQILMVQICDAQVDLKKQISGTQIDSLFESWDDPKKPGIAIGVVSNGKIDHLKAYGSANLEHNILINPQTKFHFAEMSEQIIAFGILLLSEESKLSLNDDIRKYIPSLANVYSPISIYQLLSHTSGLQDLAIIKEFAGWQGSDDFTKDHKNQFLANFRTLESKPGKKYLSKRIEAKLLQDIIETVTDQSISDFANENIFIPLGMTNTLFTDSSTEVISNKAQGYNNRDGKYEVAQMPHDKGQVDLFYSTVEDICKWAQNLSNPIVGSEDLLKSFESFVMIDGKPAELTNTSQYLGQHRYWDFGGVPKLYLIGMQAGYACKLVRFPEQDLSIVVMGNAGDYNGHWSSFAAQLYLKSYFTNQEDNETPTKKEVAFSETGLEKYTGVFWNDEDLFTARVTLENDTLRYFEEEYNWRMNLIPESTGSFKTKQGHKISFTIDANDKQLHLTMPNGNSYTSNEYQEDADWTNSLDSFTGIYANADLNSQFEVKKKDNALILSHFKLGTFEMIPIHKNRFKTTNATLKYLHFETDLDQNKILTITNDKVKDFEFNKSSEHNPF